MKRISIIFAVLIILFILIFDICSAKNPEITLSEDVDITALGEIYKLAQEYVEENIGENYKLFKMRAEYSEYNGKVEFIYTKRDGIFKDAYFVIVDETKRTISSVCQPEASRLYGGNTVVDVDMWNVDMEEYLNKPGCDSVVFETSYNNLVISYYSENKLERILEIDPKTMEILGEVLY